MRIASLNINGFGVKNLEKKRILSEFIQNHDIVCIQEAKKTIDKVGELPNIPRYEIHYNLHEEAPKCGVVTYTKLKPNNHKTDLIGENFDREGRIQLLEFDNFNLLNVYVPDNDSNPEKLNFMKSLREILAKIEGNIILCGDFNLMHKENDRENKTKNGFSPRIRSIMDDIIELGFIDSFREKHKQERKYSFPRYKIRIDYFFVSNTLKEMLKSAGICNEEDLSDHLPIFIDLDL